MDIETKVKSLKAVWVKRFLDLSAHRWKAAPSSLYINNGYTLPF